MSEGSIRHVGDPIFYIRSKFCKDSLIGGGEMPKIEFETLLGSGILLPVPIATRLLAPLYV